MHVITAQKARQKVHKEKSTHAGMLPRQAKARQGEEEEEGEEVWGDGRHPVPWGGVSVVPEQSLEVVYGARAGGER